MLNDEVIKAVEQGQFHIYVVKGVDEALELLMDMPAGERNSKNQYPKRTINYLALRRLEEIADIVNGSSDS